MTDETAIAVPILNPTRRERLADSEVNLASRQLLLSPSRLRRVMGRRSLANVPVAPETDHAAAAPGVCLSELSVRAAATRSMRRLAAALCGSAGRADGEHEDQRPGPEQALPFKIDLGGAGAGK